ncbi:hypothetical protein D9M71_700230 [compost metagenome]
MAHVFHQFAKGLARHVDVAEQLATGCAPAGQATFEQSDITVAQGQQAFGGLGGEAFAVVIQRDGGVSPRHAGKNVQFQLRQRNVGGEQRVLLGERVFLAHIDQRQFFMGQQCPANSVVGTGGNGAHGAGLSLDRSQILGSRLLE